MWVVIGGFYFLLYIVFQPDVYTKRDAFIFSSEYGIWNWRDQLVSGVL
jgi:hypothetical protein